MSPAVKAVLMSNLKTLKLATMLKHFEENVRQASESKASYEEFLLNLTEVELGVRKENGRQRRIREANFPLLKPLETFNFSAAPDLDARFIKELSCGNRIPHFNECGSLKSSSTGEV